MRCRRWLVTTSMALLAACGSDGGSNDAGGASSPQPAPTGTAGALLEVKDVGVVTKTESNAGATEGGYADLAGPAICDIRVQQLVHATVGFLDEPRRNSAALFTPQGAGCSGPFPIISYARGTSKDGARTLADPADKEARLVIHMFAARGYIVVASDYLGYAASDAPFHPYLHAGTEATSVMDAIRAARSALARAAVPTSGKLFVTGYSQGGHAALAALREIERTAGTDISVTAAAGMSGPYDLRVTLANASDAVLPSLADENPTRRAQIRILGLTDNLAEFLLNLGSFRDALERQSVVEFTPRAPLMLCGGAGDATVSFENTRSAAAAFRSRGATVTEIDIDQVPEFANRRPIEAYHHRVVPPLCAQLVRDRMFEPRR